MMTLYFSKTVFRLYTYTHQLRLLNLFWFATRKKIYCRGMFERIICIYIFIMFQIYIYNYYDLVISILVVLILKVSPIANVSIIIYIFIFIITCPAMNDTYIM